MKIRVLVDKQIWLAFVLGLVCCGRGGEPAAPGAESASVLVAAQGSGQMVALETNLRDPFSPIGYKPMAERMAEQLVARLDAAVSPDLKAKALAALRVGGVVRRGPVFLAMINGALVQAGDEVVVRIEGKTVRFVVRAINLQRVQIEPK